MTAPTDIDGLIARLESATGEEWSDLDGLVAVASGKAIEVNPKNCRYVRYRDEETGEPHDTFSKVAPYCSSIDAALTLVPEGWGVSGFTNCTLDSKYFDVRKHTNWSVSCARIGESFAGRIEAIAKIPIGIAPTPALALCIAALKARGA